MNLAFGAMPVAAAAVELCGIFCLSHPTWSLTLIGEDRIPKVQRQAAIYADINLIALELRNTLTFDAAAKIRASIEATTKAREDVEGTRPVAAVTTF